MSLGAEALADADEFSSGLGKGGPGGFYERLGLVATGEVDSEGETILRRPL
jgi:hypothetical protein